MENDSTTRANTVSATAVMGDLMQALCNAQEVSHLTYRVGGAVGGNKPCAKECREAQEAVAEAEAALPTITTVSASVRYSRKLGDGSHKTIELSAEVALAASENWQEIQSKLYGDLCLQLKTLWATRNNVPSQEPEAHTTPRLP